jgi:Ni/Fe-hydrogenase subunit HybB-like protein
MSHVYVYDYVSVSVYDYVSVSVYVHVCNVFNLCDVYTFLKAISVMQETRAMHVR